MEGRNFELSEFTSVHSIAHRLTLGFGVYFLWESPPNRRRRRLSLSLREFRKLRELWAEAFREIKRVHDAYWRHVELKTLPPRDANETTIHLEPLKVDQIFRPLSSRLMLTLLKRVNLEGGEHLELNISPFKRVPGQITPEVEYDEGVTLNYLECARLDRIFPHLHNRVVKDLTQTKTFTIADQKDIQEVRRSVKSFHRNKDITCLRMVLLKETKEHLDIARSAVDQSEGHPLASDEPFSETQLVERWLKLSLNDDSKPASSQSSAPAPSTRPKNTLSRLPRKKLESDAELSDFNDNECESGCIWDEEGYVVGVRTPSPSDMDRSDASTRAVGEPSCTDSDSDMDDDEKKPTFGKRSKR